MRVFFRSNERRVDTREKKRDRKREGERKRVREISKLLKLTRGQVLELFCK